MSPADRERLAKVLLSFDDAGLVALSNKGMVRRALKDLPAEKLSFEETDSALLVRGAGWLVTMPASGPASATDDTRATGVTRQILLATIFLRDTWAGAHGGAPPKTPVAEVTDAIEAPEIPEVPVERAKPVDAVPPVIAQPVQDGDVHAGTMTAVSQVSDSAAQLLRALEQITLEDLRKWAGKTLLKEVQTLLNPGPRVEVETHAGISLRLVEHEVEARLLPLATSSTSKGLLDSMLTTARKAQHKRYVVLTVLAYHVSRGIVWETAGAERTMVAAPHSQGPVLTTVLHVLEGMVTTGLAHPSERMQTRLLTLSMSVAAQKLPRLSRRLRSLADDVGWILARDAQASTEGFLDRLSTTNALARALLNSGEKTPVALAGKLRSEFEPAGQLALFGVGAFPWKTPSGFVGVTSLFWDLLGRRFYSYTASRPISQALGFSVDHSYHNEPVWTGGGPLGSLSRSSFLLNQSKANAEGRLSASASCTAEVLGATEPATLDFGERMFRNWTELCQYARHVCPLGLQERGPLERIVVLLPAVWGRRMFDDVQQRFLWELLDDQGQVLTMSVDWRETNETAIEFLELIRPDGEQLCGVLARVIFGAGLQVEPISLFSRGTLRGHQVLNPAFDRGLIESKRSGLLATLQAKYGRNQTASMMTAGDDSDDWLPVATSTSSALESRLSGIENCLLRFGEMGARPLSQEDSARVTRLVQEAEHAGLSELSRGLNEMLTGPPARGLIKTRYLCRLHREALSVPRTPSRPPSLPNE